MVFFNLKSDWPLNFPKKTSATHEEEAPSNSTAATVSPPSFLALTFLELSRFHVHHTTFFHLKPELL
jgi:hypothetical protein